MNGLSKRGRTLKCPVVLALVSCLLTAGLSAAESFLEEPFDYADGDLVGALASPWNAHSGAGSGPMQVVEGKLRIASSGAEDVHAPLQGAPYAIDGAVARLFATFKLKCTALPSSAGTYFAHFRSGSAQRARVWISRANAADGFYRLGIGNSSGANADSGQIPLDLRVGEAYEVTVRYDLSSGSSSIGLGVMSESELQVTAVDSVGLTAIEEFAWRQAGGMGSLEIDDLKVSNELLSPGVRLRVDVEDGELVLRWPAAETGYVLQSVAVVGEGGWVDDATPGLVEGEERVIRYPMSAKARFFRLVQALP